MFSKIRKSMALEAFRGRLGRELVRRHGGHRMYTAAEVRTSARSLGLPADYLSYAYALYCTEAEFDAHHARIGLRRSYAEHRAHVVPRFHLPGTPRARERDTDDDGGMELPFDLGSLFDDDGDGSGGGGDGGGGD